MKKKATKKKPKKSAKGVPAGNATETKLLLAKKPTKKWYQFWK